MLDTSHSRAVLLRRLDIRVAQQGMYSPQGLHIFKAMPWKNTSLREQRWKFVQMAMRTVRGLAELCRRSGVSRKTAYKWIERFKERGRFGLDDRKRVAHRVEGRPSEVWLERIRRYKCRHPSWGAPKIRWALERRFGRKELPSEAAIGRWLREWGLTRRRRRRILKGPSITRPGLSEAKKANDVWTVDFKGWFKTGDGSRVEPLTVRDLASRYVLDICLMRQQNVEDTKREFERIFRDNGLPLVIRVDNGSPFGSRGGAGADPAERVVGEIGDQSGIYRAWTSGAEWGT